MSPSEVLPEEVLDDLQSRFLLNLPEEELASFDRICFQIEQAHWFYIDFIHEKNPSLPAFSKLHKFAEQLFNHCPLLISHSSECRDIINSFSKYKLSIPTCGAILLNQCATKVLLVRGWNKNASWGFPKGKINQHETAINCAIRECLEETGFDISTRICEDEFFERTSGRSIRLYVIQGVPENTVFQTKTRREIGDIQWHDINSICKNKDGKRYWMTVSFVFELRTWLQNNNIGPWKSKKKKQAVTTVDNKGDRMSVDMASSKHLMSLLCVNNTISSDLDSEVKSDHEIEVFNPFLNFQFDYDKLLTGF